MSDGKARLPLPVPGVLADDLSDETALEALERVKGVVTPAWLGEQLTDYLGLGSEALRNVDFRPLRLTTYSQLYRLEVELEGEANPIHFIVRVLSKEQAVEREVGLMRLLDLKRVAVPKVVAVHPGERVEILEDLAPQALFEEGLADPRQVDGALGILARIHGLATDPLVSSWRRSHGLGELDRVDFEGRLAQLISEHGRSYLPEELFSEKGLLDEEFRVAFARAAYELGVFVAERCTPFLSGGSLPTMTVGDVRPEHFRHLAGSIHLVSLQHAGRLGPPFGDLANLLEWPGMQEVLGPLDRQRALDSYLNLRGARGRGISSLEFHEAYRAVALCHRLAFFRLGKLPRQAVFPAGEPEGPEPVDRLRELFQGRLPRSEVDEE